MIDCLFPLFHSYRESPFPMNGMPKINISYLLLIGTLFQALELSSRNNDVTCVQPNGYTLLPVTPTYCSLYDFFKIMLTCLQTRNELNAVFCIFSPLLNWQTRKIRNVNVFSGGFFFRLERNNYFSTFTIDIESSLMHSCLQANIYPV